LIRKVIRILFLALLFFYSLNLFQVLHIPLDFSWIGLISTALGAWLLLEKFDLPDWIWLLSFFAITLDACSDIFHLYSHLESWDRLMHFWGGMFLSFPLLQLMSNFQEKQNSEISRLFFLIILISFIGLLGTFYEILEYLTDKFYFGHPKALGDGADTVEDLVFNLVGGIFGYTIYLMLLSQNIIRRVIPRVKKK